MADNNSTLPGGAQADEYCLQARFWQSPFALCAAVAVTAQMVILALAGLNGRTIPYDTLYPLTTIAAMMLTAGICPNWNFLKVDEDAVEQHAGLTAVRVPWEQVRSIDSYAQGLAVHYVSQTKAGEQRMRTARLMNRYGMSAERFADMIEAAWQRGYRGAFA